jgi:hypothetical protein
MVSDNVNDSAPSGAIRLDSGTVFTHWLHIDGTNLTLRGAMTGGNPVAVLDATGQIGDVSVVPVGQGQIGVLYNHEDIGEGRTDLHWRRVAILPDLTVSAEVISERADPASATFLLRFENRGIGSAGPVKIGVYDGDPDAGGSLITTVDWNTLPGGSAVQWMLFYQPSPPGEALASTVWFVADPDSVVAESDESNNRISLNLRQPNWGLSRGGVGFIASNRLHRIELTVANYGALATPATTVEMRVNDVVTTNSTIGTLVPGAMTNVVFTADLLALLPNGPVTLALVVDPGNAVTEEDELDNELRLRVTRISDGFSDVDGDGVDDNWELRHFAALLRDGLADRDGDGVSDRDEYLADTDPNDPADRLFLDVSRDANRTRVQWNARPGRAYRVEVIDNLGGTNNWQTGDDDRRPSGFTTRREEFQDDGATGIRFYRVRIVP